MTSETTAVELKTGKKSLKDDLVAQLRASLEDLKAGRVRRVR